MEDNVLWAAAFKALSDPTRLEIIQRLSCQEMSTNRLLECFPITQPTLFHHLKVLASTGLIVGRKEGKMAWYRLNGERIREFARFLSATLSCPADCPHQGVRCTIALDDTNANTRRKQSMTTMKLKIEGMHCNGCAMGLEGALEDLPQVTAASVSFPDKTAEIQCEGELPSMDLLRKTVADAGFTLVD